MSLEVGIVGLANVGKSTLFNALVKRQQAYVANFPFATIEPNIGVVPVPDSRLERLRKVVESEIRGYKDTKILGQNSSHAVSQYPSIPLVPATVTFVDIAGLIAGAHMGEGLGNKFLAHIREVDVICHVVRAFRDPDIIKQGVVDPKSDFETVKTELELADLEHPAAAPLAKKPTLVVLNVDEGDLKNASRVESDFAESLKLKASQVVAICAKTESQLASLSEIEQKEYLEALGVRHSGLERLIQKAYALLGLISFLTAGPKEVRAWTIRLGSTSLMASGQVHTDFMQHFIKADVCNFDDFIALGGWKNAREAGKVRSEGKDYIVRDGDVIEFKVGT